MAFVKGYCGECVQKAQSCLCCRFVWLEKVPGQVCSLSTKQERELFVLHTLCFHTVVSSFTVTEVSRTELLCLLISSLCEAGQRGINYWVSKDSHQSHGARGLGPVSEIQTLVDVILKL